MPRGFRAAVMILTFAMSPALTGTTANAAESTNPGSGPNLGGYIFHQIDQTIDVSFRAPEWRCGPEDEGISTVVLATGSRDGLGGAGVQASCVAGRRHFRAAFIGPDTAVDPIDGQVRPGDLMRVVISLNREDLLITVSNVTRGWGVGTGQSDVAGRITTAQVGDKLLTIDGQALPVPSFGTHDVESLSFDGAPPAPWTYGRRVLRGEDGTTLVRPSQLLDGRTTFTLISTR